MSDLMYIFITLVKFEVSMFFILDEMKETYNQKCSYRGWFGTASALSGATKFEG